MWNWNRIACFALGAGCFVAAAFLPAMAGPLVAAGALATGTGVPSQVMAPIVRVLRGVLGALPVEPATDKDEKKDQP